MAIGARGRATGWCVTSWALFATSGPLAAAVMAAGWSAAAVTSVRIASAAVLLLPVVAAFRPRALRCRRRDLWLLLGYGVLGVAGVQLLFFVAVQRVPVGVAMVLVGLAPLLVAVWVQVVRRTRVPVQVWLGLGSAVAGLTLVARIRQGTELDLLGVAAGLCSAVCSAGYFLLGERAASRYDPLGLTAIGLTVGAAVTWVLTPPLALPLRSLKAPAAVGGVRIPVWSVLLVLVVAGTVLPYVAGLRALRELPAAFAAVLAVVEPLVAAGLAWLLLGQSLGPDQLFGAILMLAGVLLVQLIQPDAQVGDPVRR
ncbi:EamA family transporter [Nocardia stercoris]|uniref:EamA family transporter n=1 Tax=Nocardia stercoris TaxID=2483361 RepID=A0A3M2KZD0_9NOCA|nr:EamA family transporter [Nocardia stercoris]RMI30651.1 EamA family transporter [Nocardia stercoris]